MAGGLMRDVAEKSGIGRLPLKGTNARRTSSVPSSGYCSSASMCLTGGYGLKRGEMTF
jgi:hypothetical protein